MLNKNKKNNRNNNKKKELSITQLPARFLLPLLPHYAFAFVLRDLKIARNPPNDLGHKSFVKTIKDRAVAPFAHLQLTCSQVTKGS